LCVAILVALAFVTLAMQLKAVSLLKK